MLNNSLSDQSTQTTNTRRDISVSRQLFRRIAAGKYYYLYHQLRIENIKKLVYYLKTEDLRSVINRVVAYMERLNTAKPFQPQVLADPRPDFKLVFNQSDNPLVSIIIPVHNQWDYTHRCLYSICQHIGNIAYEIIIADDASTDETTCLEKYAENVRIIRNNQAQGFLRNCNNAARYAQGKYIYLLNNDTCVQPGWLDALTNVMEGTEGIGIAGSKLVYPGGRLQEAGGIIWNDGSGWNYGRLDDPSQPEYNYIKQVDYISGASIMIRKELWHEIGGFDTRYAPAYYEDTDLAFEVRRRGYQVVYQPQSVVVHFEGASHGQDRSSGVKRYQDINREKFVEKWAAILKNESFSNGSDVFQARDRSRYKKTILVIDHYVPHHDRDAGGRCTYQYLRLLKALGLHVIFLGDNFFNHEPYTSQLQQLGIEVLYGERYVHGFDEWLESNGKYLDFVYLNRPHVAVKYMEKIKQKTCAKVFYFGHDLHYLRELRQYDVERNPALLESAKRWKVIEDSLFTMTDIIHVVGSYEERLLKERFPDKNVRNIPLYIYGAEETTSEPVNVDPKSDILFVGGFNHKPNVDAVLWFVKEVFPAILSSCPDARFYVVGSNPPQSIKELASEQIVVTGAVSDQQLKEYYGRSRVAVVPLRYGAGVKGKVVEALYYGLPVVTTSIGAEGLVDANTVLFIADDKAEFARLTIQAYMDSGLLQAAAVKGQQYIAEHYSVAKAQQILLGDMGVSS